MIFALCRAHHVRIATSWKHPSILKWDGQDLCLPKINRKILAPPSPHSPDNCCPGCCGHDRDRNTGPNAEPALKYWIGANEGDLAAGILGRQTNPIHELVKWVPRCPALRRQPFSNQQPSSASAAHPFRPFWMQLTSPLARSISN